MAKREIVWWNGWMCVHHWVEDERGFCYDGGMQLLYQCEKPKQ